MPGTKTQDWRRAYERAMQEGDPRKLKELVFHAEEGLFYRYKELVRSSDHQEERRQMRTAAHDLLNLKVTKLGYPRPAW